MLALSEQQETPTIKTMANLLWSARGGKISTIQEQENDYFFAVKAIRDINIREYFEHNSNGKDDRWLAWSIQNLRPYLTLKVKTQPRELASKLKSDCNALAESGDSKVYLIVTLDGAVEFARACYKKHLGNCVSPKDVIESKDTVFYRFCSACLSREGGFLLDQGRLTVDKIGLTQSRHFQDGCAVMFPKGAISKILKCVVRLRQSLEGYNYKNSLNWIDQLHCRVSIGGSWLDAVNVHGNLRRGEVRLAHKFFDSLTADAKELCLLAGASYESDGWDRHSSQETEYGRSILSGVLERTPA